MPPVVNPVSDLARIYRQRVPTQTAQAKFGPEAVARIQPNMNRGAGPLGAVGRFAQKAVGSLDPRFILSEGGRGVEHAVGDVTELGRSVITGQDTLSQSPSARAYQAAGGGAPGVFAAAIPYVNVASALVPEARLLTRSGRVAAGAEAIDRGIQRAIATSAEPTQYGIHISPSTDLPNIRSRNVLDPQVTAADAQVGSSYMWDARTPNLDRAIFNNPQMRDMAGLGEPPPTIYVTRPMGRVFQDANVPNSPSLRVAGGQEIIQQLPFDQVALRDYLDRLGVRARSEKADLLEQKYRGLAPTVRTDIAQRPIRLAEERLRTAIKIANESPLAPNYLGLSGIDARLPLSTLLKNENAKKAFGDFVELSRQEDQPIQIASFFLNDSPEDIASMFP